MTRKSQRKGLQPTVRVISRLVLFLLLAHHISAQQYSGDDSDDEDSVSTDCADKYFPCYKDCCLKNGEWYCHHSDQRCYQCNTRKDLCGNESLPRDCLLYCYKLHHPPDPYEDTVCISSPLFIAGTTIAGSLILVLIISNVVVVVQARSPKRCPTFPFGLLAHQQTSYNAQNQDPTAPEEELPMMEPADNATDDNNVGSPPPSHSPSSTSRPSSFDRPTLEGLNLTNVNNEDDDSPTQMTAEACPKGGKASHQGPDANNDVEVGSQGIPGSIPAHGRSVPVDGAQRPNGNLPPSSQQDAQPFPQGHHGYSVNEVRNTPDFSKINPTSGTDTQDCLVIAPGTENPAKNYRHCPTPDPPQPM